MNKNTSSETLFSSCSSGGRACKRLPSLIPLPLLCCKQLLPPLQGGRGHSGMSWRFYGHVTRSWVVGREPSVLLSPTLEGGTGAGTPLSIAHGNRPKASMTERHYSKSKHFVSGLALTTCASSALLTRSNSFCLWCFIDLRARSLRMPLLTQFGHSRGFRLLWQTWHPLTSPSPILRLLKGSAGIHATTTPLSPWVLFLS